MALPLLRPRLLFARGVLAAFAPDSHVVGIKLIEISTNQKMYRAPSYDLCYYPTGHLPKLPQAMQRVGATAVLKDDRPDPGRMELRRLWGGL
jgi:hypothetical protein